MKAVERYDWRLGHRFSTYATWWIRQAVTRGLADHARTIRVPAQVVDTINRMARVERQLMQKFGRPPTNEELATELGLKPEKVIELKRVSQEPVSLAVPVGEDATTLGELLEDHHQGPPEGEMADQQRHRTIADLVAVAAVPGADDPRAALRARRSAAAHAGGGRPPVRGHPRARPPDRDAHAAPARRPGRASRAAAPDRALAARRSLVNLLRRSSVAQWQSIRLLTGGL